ncbi:MAG: transcriptional repressor LexA [Chloroflexota bacterium]|nr:transcriptional repressor LexA [Chloroflexota bacterium]
MNKTLSPRQKEILRYIREFSAEHGRPPTVREIQKALEISSTSVVDYNLNQLVEKGELRRNRNISRGIELTEPAPSLRDDTISVPIVGTIAAGAPIEVPESLPDPHVWGDTVDLNPSFMDLRGDGLFALRVKGYSMVDALIGDGDIVLMRHQETAENGETVAVWIESERTTTLKKFYNEGSRVRLQPANVTMQPIYADPTDVAIQGKLVGVIRQLGR